MNSGFMKNKFKIPAIVLGSSVNSLGVIRSLARHHIPVYAIDSSKHYIFMSSRYAKALICPDIKNDPKAFIEFLLSLSKKRGGKAVIFPTSDIYNEFINNNRGFLYPSLMFAMPKKTIMEQMLNKKGQYLLANQLKVSMPGTYFPKNMEEIHNLTDKLNYPVCVKGNTTNIWREKFADKKAFIANNPDELIDFYADMNSIFNFNLIIQEIIPGEDKRYYELCTYFDRKVRELLTFTFQKIRQYPMNFGIGACIISKRVPEIIEIGLGFMKELGYWGVVNIEFKKDPRDEKFKMIEINPRMWAQNSLAAACGQNFPLIAYLDILGYKPNPRLKFTENMKWIAFQEDRATFKEYYKHGLISKKDWLQSIFMGRRVWSVWSWDDPLPFLKSVKYGFLILEKIFSRLLKNYKLAKEKGKRMPTKHMNYKKYIKYSLIMTQLHHVLRFINRKKALIIMYHNLSDNNDINHKNICISVEEFERQIKYLKKYYTFVSLQDLVQRLKNKREFLPYSVAITFDDGYKNNFLYAYPIIKKYKVPVTVFLTTGFIDSKRYLWVNELEYALSKTRKNKIQISYGTQKFNYVFSSENDKKDAYIEIKERLKEIDNTERRICLNKILTELDVMLNPEKSKNYLMLSLNEISEMRKNYVSYGNHTISHPILTMIQNDNELLEEIYGPHEFLKEKLGEEIESFCYPNGKFNLKIKDIVKQKYEYAVTTTPGFVTIDTDPLELPRVGTKAKMLDFIWASIRPT